MAAEPRVVHDAVLEAARLADIDGVALGVDHAIDAGSVRQVSHECADDGRARPLGFSPFAFVNAHLIRTAHGPNIVILGAWCKWRDPRIPQFDLYGSFLYY